MDNTKDRIFPSNVKGNKKKQVKKYRDANTERGIKNTYNDHLNGLFVHDYDVQKWDSKPCNNDYKAVTDEARKNASVRYYYENNRSQL